jgi:hypothetical protein
MRKCRNRITGEIVFLKDNEIDFNLYDYSNKLEVTVKDPAGNIFNVFNKDPRYLNKELLPPATKYVIDCSIHGIQVNLPEHSRNLKKPIPEKFKIYCPECREYYKSDEYIPSDYDIKMCHEFLDNFHFFNSKQYSEKYWNKIIPHFTKCVYHKTDSIAHHINTFADRIYAFKNNIYEMPVCSLLGCSDRCHFLKSQMGISRYCEAHAHADSISGGEEEVYNFIRKNYSNKIIQSYRKGGYEIDILIPDLNLGIEYNGLWWHSDNYKDKNAHINKWKYFKGEKIKLITIWGDDWKYKNDLVKSIIKNQLGLNETKIYARKTEIREVDYKTSSIFLEKNHIQGNSQASIRLGLFYNDELVSLMTFGKKRMILKSKSKLNQYELLRFCNNQNISVIGGASKLFKHFINNFNPEEIVSYANLDISNGNLYKTLGFENIQSASINYWWVKDRRYHRSNFMKHKLVKEGADANKTADEIMREKKYFKIYGSGNLKFVWKK